MKKFPSIILSTILIAALIFTTGCWQANKTTPIQVRIGTQYGFNWTPIMIMQQQKLVEKYLPNSVVNYDILTTAAAMNEGLIAGRLQAAGLGTSSFLTGWEKAGTKIICGVDSADFGLVTSKPYINSLKDFKTDDKIAVPGMNSMQHIILSMNAKKELGDPHAMDSRLTFLANPDGYSAFAGGSIAAHYATSPYRFQEQKLPGAHEITKASDVLGKDWTASLLVGPSNLDPKIRAALQSAMKDAMTFIENNPKEASAIIAPLFKMTPEETELYINKDIKWSQNVYSLYSLADYMKSANLIKKVPAGFQDIIWDKSLLQESK